MICYVQNPESEIRIRNPAFENPAKSGIRNPANGLLHASLAATEFARTEGWVGFEGCCAAPSFHISAQLFLLDLVKLILAEKRIPLQ